MSFSADTKTQIDAALKKQKNLPTPQEHRQMHEAPAPARTTPTPPANNYVPEDYDNVGFNLPKTGKVVLASLNEPPRSQPLPASQPKKGSSIA